MKRSKSTRKITANHAFLDSFYWMALFSGIVAAASLIGDLIYQEPPSISTISNTALMVSLFAGGTLGLLWHYTGELEKEVWVLPFTIPGTALTLLLYIQDLIIGIQNRADLASGTGIFGGLLAMSLTYQLSRFADIRHSDEQLELNYAAKEAVVEALEAADKALDSEH